MFNKIHLPNFFRCILISLICIVSNYFYTDHILFICSISSIVILFLLGFSEVMMNHFEIKIKQLQKYIEELEK